MPSFTATLERFSSSTPRAMPLTYSTTSGRLVLALASSAFDGDFLGNREVVAFGMFPVDQPDGAGVLTHLGFDLHAVAQQFVHRLVAVIQVLADIVGGLVELEDGRG
jgi:hypothetical protein